MSLRNWKGETDELVFEEVFRARSLGEDLMALVEDESDRVRLEALGSFIRRLAGTVDTDPPDELLGFCAAVRAIVDDIETAAGEEIRAKVSLRRTF